MAMRNDNFCEPHAFLLAQGEFYARRGTKTRARFVQTPSFNSARLHLYKSRTVFAVSDCLFSSSRRCFHPFKCAKSGRRTFQAFDIFAIVSTCLSAAEFQFAELPNVLILEPFSLFSFSPFVKLASLIVARLDKTEATEQAGYGERGFFQNYPLCLIFHPTRGINSALRWQTISPDVIDTPDGVLLFFTFTHTRPRFPCACLPRERGAAEFNNTYSNNNIAVRLPRRRGVLLKLAHINDCCKFFFFFP